MLGTEIEVVVALPFQRVRRSRKEGARRDLDHRLRVDPQLGVFSQHVEMIDRVSVMICVCIKLRSRTGGDLKIAQRLMRFRARLHLKLHSALANRIGVAEACDMPEGVEHEGRSYSTVSAS